MLTDAELLGLGTQLIYGVLVFVRISAITFLGPLFSHTSIPAQVKIFLSGLLAIVATSGFGDQQPSIDVEVFTLIPLVFKEFLIGAAIGFAMNMLFYAVRFAGGLLDFDIGFQTALLFDASAEVPTLIGELKNMMMLMIFLIVNGHHFVLEAVYASVRMIPLDQMVISGAFTDIVIRMITVVTIVAMKIAAPVLLALFVTNIALALMSRVAPQLNIFTLSLQFKVIVGLLVLFLSLPLFIMVGKVTLTAFQDETWRVIQSLNPSQVTR